MEQRIGLPVTPPPAPLPTSNMMSTMPAPPPPPPIQASSVGLVRVLSPQDTERLRQQQADYSNPQPLIPELVGYIRGRWESAKRAKISIEEEMIEAARARKGEYSPEKLAKIRQAGGSEAYFNLTETKCRAAKAWIEDVVLQAGQKSWGLRPSPKPDLSPTERQKLSERIREAAITQAVMAEQQSGQAIDVRLLRQRIDAALIIAEAKMTDAEMVQAKATAAKMEKTIEDNLSESRFQEEFRDFIDDIVTFQCSVLKGPFARNENRLGWKATPAGMAPEIAPRLMVKAKRVNPLNCYPSADATGPNDGDFIERVRYTRRDLSNMKGIPGYRDDAINAVLYEHRSGGLREWLWTDGEVDRIRNISQLSSYDTSKIDGLECYLSVPGSLLVDWNIPGVQDIAQEYEIVAILIGRHLVYATLNPHPLGHRPYSVASMMTNPDGFWGRSIPQMIKHDAESASMLYRSAINNAAMSALPLVQEMVDRLAPGEVPGQLYPGKVYLTTDDMSGGSRAPVEFFSVPITATKLVEVLKFCSAMADEHSGVPAYAHGSESVGGAGDTASGLSMLMSAAARGIKNVVRNIDEALEQFIGRCYVWEMLYNPDQTIKGDLEVQVYGSSELLIKEQMLIRRKELLQATNNPVDLQIMGFEGRANLLASTSKAMDIDPEDIIRGAPVAPASPVVDPANNQQPQQQPQPQQQATQATDAAGAPAGGTDTSLFSQASGQ